MNDTHPEIERKMQEMFQKKSPTERFKMGCSMCETSRTLIIQSILRNNPGISKVELKKKFFLLYYGEDFSPAEQEKILQHLEKVS